MIDAISVGKIYKYNTNSEKVSDMFYIYDLRINNITSKNCVNQLLKFHHEKKGGKKYNIKESTVTQFYNQISNFMKEFRKKYTMQTSNLYRSTT